ncbi:MAG: hypothetical protein HQK63_17425 [Desulfamplus sp.]|nr:hypothetical protein [Desulfamplus sp.]
MDIIGDIYGQIFFCEDKMGQSKLCGKKLKITMELRAIRADDLSTQLNVQPGTIEKWKERGISKRKIVAAALYLMVDEQLLINDEIDEKTFETLLKERISIEISHSKEKDKNLDNPPPTKGILSSDFDKASVLSRFKCRI